MKPTVINSSNSEPHPVHHEQPNMDSNNAANAGPNAAHNDQSRRFPQFRVSVLDRSIFRVNVCVCKRLQSAVPHLEYSREPRQSDFFCRSNQRI